MTERHAARRNIDLPIVALYWLENRLLTYWFMSDVFPTLDVSNVFLADRGFVCERFQTETAIKEGSSGLA